MPAVNPLIDDFEDADIADWYYDSKHEYPAQSGEFIPGVSHALTTDAASGQYALVITNLTPPGSSSAYNRKTFHSNWTGYTTLEFDAKVADSNTSQGFEAAVGAVAGYQRHQFFPTDQWKSFKIDISKDNLVEVTNLAFYINRPGAYGVPQSGSQKLYLDNIRLTKNAVPTTFATIGDAKAMDDGSVVTLQGKVSTGEYADWVPDMNAPATLRTMFFLEEPDRSIAIPVVLGSGPVAAGVLSVPEGAKVNVTGLLVTGNGTRYIYATSVTVAGTGFPIPEPIGLTNKACGIGPRGLDQGVPGFAGMDTTGMLAVICGRITGSGYHPVTARSFFYVDDGSHVAADGEAVGVKVYDNYSGFYEGQYVRIVGYVMTDPELDDFSYAPTGKPIRAFWPKRELATPIEAITE